MRKTAFKNIEVIWSAFFQNVGLKVVPSRKGADTVSWNHNVVNIKETKKKQLTMINPKMLNILEYT